MWHNIRLAKTIISAHESLFRLGSKNNLSKEQQFSDELQWEKVLFVWTAMTHCAILRKSKKFFGGLMTEIEKPTIQQPSLSMLKLCSHQIHLQLS